VKHIAGKQHDTFPGEQPEMPVPKEQPEVGQPSDPKAPEVPQEAPQVMPDEYPLQKIRPKRRWFSTAIFDGRRIDRTRRADKSIGAFNVSPLNRGRSRDYFRQKY
jgi:hypothetical protein